MNAIWFSRHEATASQIAEIQGMGYTLVAGAEAKALASRNLNSDEEFKDMVSSAEALLRQNGVQAVFGVFAAPMQHMLYCGSLDAAGYAAETGIGLPGAECFAAWNVQRSVEGGKPTFEHLRFVSVGFWPLR